MCRQTQWRAQERRLVSHPMPTETSARFFCRSSAPTGRVHVATHGGRVGGWLRLIARSALTSQHMLPAGRSAWALSLAFERWKVGRGTDQRRIFLAGQLRQPSPGIGCTSYSESQPVAQVLLTVASIHCAQMLSNGLFPSTMHTASCLAADRSRFSVPFFWSPSQHVVIEPLPHFITADRPAQYQATASGGVNPSVRLRRQHVFLTQNRVDFARSIPLAERARPLSTVGRPTREQTRSNCRLRRARAGCERMATAGTVAVALTPALVGHSCSSKSVEACSYMHTASRSGSAHGSASPAFHHGRPP